MDSQIVETPEDIMLQTLHLLMITCTHVELLIDSRKNNPEYLSESAFAIEQNMKMAANSTTFTVKTMRNKILHIKDYTETLLKHKYDINPVSNTLGKSSTKRQRIELTDLDF
jgi:hypothetical protein